MNSSSPLQTWSGTHRFTAPRLVEARAIADVQAAVRAGGPVRALGTRHSFNDIADTTGALVSVLGIDPDPVLDEAAREVTVGAGTRYGVLAVWLEQRGWALHNLGSLPHISIGGAIATGTHGSGNGNGVLATAVRGIDYVDAAGELRSVRHGDPDFDALVISLGAVGITVRVTLAIEPSYRVRQDVFVGLSWNSLLSELEAVTGAGYSVSLLSNWLGEGAGDIWMKSRIEGEGDGEMPETLFDASRDPALEPIFAPAENLTTQGGVPGPWSERLPHFRLDATPSNGDEIQTEYFVDRAIGAPALAAVRELRDDIAPLLAATELRTAKADSLWLSEAFERDVLGIHFTWKNEPEPVRALLPRIEAALAPFDARPHWGKWHAFDAERIAAVTPKLAEARAVFERLDPEGRFSNAHLERIGVRAPRA